PSAGTDIVTYSTHGGGTPLGSALLQVRGAQSVIDLGSCNTIAAANATLNLTTQNYTAAVPNELLIALAADSQIPASCNIAISAPFSLIVNSNNGIVNNCQTYASYFPSAAGTYTATATASGQPTGGGAGGNQTDFVTLIGLRPAIFVVPFYQGERP